MLARELFEAAARFLPALRRAAERLVVLQRELRIGRLRAERLPIGLRGGRGLAALRKLARLPDRLIGRTRLAEATRELIGRRVVRRRFAQTRQVLLRAVAVLAVGEHEAHAVQRVGLFRIDAQHLLPRLLGQIAAPARLPVLALIDQHFQRIVRGRRRWRLPLRGDGHGRSRAERDEDADYERAWADGHRFSQRGASRPVASKR
ncbi:hypothetical protein LMG29739_06175 [Paraburkholderia solisilvae]|uniref:Uncharacterized protein n=1 Tax=Paraburkholderia solisilvae TaxID=624376 RepID=A0A6J5F0V5_9BURK|nr:hypothetical protein LMG29739_06175 [Paraburkholderia solisilvae]